MTSLSAASRKQHPPNGQKASSYAPVSQGKPLAYHMTPEQPDPMVSQAMQTVGKKKMHAPGMRGRNGNARNGNPNSY